MAYMEMFGNCSHTNNNDSFLRHSMHTYNELQTEWQRENIMAAQTRLFYYQRERLHTSLWFGLEGTSSLDFTNSFSFPPLLTVLIVLQLQQMFQTALLQHCLQKNLRHQVCGQLVALPFYPPSQQSLQVHLPCKPLHLKICYHVVSLKGSSLCYWFLSLFAEKKKGGKLYHQD